MRYFVCGYVRKCKERCQIVSGTMTKADAANVSIRCRRNGRKYMNKIVGYKEIERSQWETLVRESSTGTWFQGPEAYSFYESLPELFRPFVVGIARDAEHLETSSLDAARLESSTLELRGICVGYVTVEKSALKQMMTRRAIIVGGPVLADDCTEEEACALMQAVRQRLMIDDRLKMNPIFIESRNFNDYSRWKSAFEKAGFEYVPHLNFHVDTSSAEVVEANLGKSRKRDIRTTIREGVSIVSLNEPIQNDASLMPNEPLRSMSRELCSLNDEERERKVREYYEILSNLYKTKVKTPLFPVEFFLELSKQKDARFLLTEYQGHIVGGTVCVMQEGKCLYEWFVCGEDGVYVHVFPSSYATYAGIKYAAEHNCPRFDMMGAGKPDEAYGVRDFKARFGGKEVENGRFLCVTKPILYQIGKFGVWLLKRLK